LIQLIRQVKHIVKIFFLHFYYIFTIPKCYLYSCFIYSVAYAKELLGTNHCPEGSTMTLVQLKQLVVESKFICSTSRKKVVKDKGPF
jgi:hypothetical protein